MKNNNFNIDFKPMISELKPRDLNNIQYSTTSFLFKRFPQWFLFIFNKLKLVFFALGFLYFGLSILLSTVFGISWFLDKVLIVIPICMVLTFLSFHMDVQSNIGIMREEEFNRHNDENVFWSPLDLDDDMRYALNIYDVIGALNISNKYAQANNVLGFKDSKMSTGDIVYYTREYDIDGDDTMKRHGCPYVAMPMDTELPSMKLLRKNEDLDNNFDKANIGVVSGVAITDEKSGTSKLDWSTVNLNKMEPAQVELGKNYVDFNAKGVYGSIANGHVREMGAGDNVLVVSDGREAFRPFEVYGDGSEFADTNLKLIVNPFDVSDLNVKDELKIQRKIAEYGNSLLGSSDKDHTDGMSALMNVYNHDLYSSDGIDLVKNQSIVMGSIKDIASDVKAFAKSKEKTVDDVLADGGGVLQEVGGSILNTETGEYELGTLKVAENEFSEFAKERESIRGINEVVFSNLVVKDIDPSNSSLEIRNWENAKINETKARRFAKDMSHTVSYELEDGLKNRPYTISSAVRRAKEVELEQPKDKTKVTPYSLER